MLSSFCVLLLLLVLSRGGVGGKFRGEGEAEAGSDRHLKWESRTRVLNCEIQVLGSNVLLGLTARSLNFEDGKGYAVVKQKDAISNCLRNFGQVEQEREGLFQNLLRGRMSKEWNC